MRSRTIVVTSLFWILASVAFGQPLDTITPWRVQVRVHTCDLAEAGTDSKVFVRFTSVASDQFWLSRGRDDRKRNHADTYDVWIRDPLTAGSTTTMGNITELTLGINGGDKWCFDRVELFINNPSPGEISPITAAGYRVFDSGAIAGGIWISTGDRSDPSVVGSQFTIAPLLFRALRGSLWNVSGLRTFILRCPRVVDSLGDGLVGIERAVLEEMFESFLGHLMGPGEDLSGFRYGTRVGRSHVSVRRLSDSTIKVDADIVREHSRDFAARRWDKEIVLEFLCSGGQLTVNALRVDVDARRWMNWISLGVTRGLEALLERIADNRLGLAVSLPLPLCVPPRFTSEGDLTFEGTASCTVCYPTFCRA